MNKLNDRKTLENVKVTVEKLQVTVFPEDYTCDDLRKTPKPSETLEMPEYHRFAPRSEGQSLEDPRGQINLQENYVPETPKTPEAQKTQNIGDEYYVLGLDPREF